MQTSSRSSSINRSPKKGNHTFKLMKEITRQRSRNARAIKVLFGGGNRGSLDKVFPTDKYFAEAGTVWDVPESEGAYPGFNPNGNDQTKKKEISDFIVRETDIKTVESVENLQKTKLIENVKECYIQELHQGDYIEYDGRSLLNILTHTKDKYARRNVHILKANLKVFGKEPLMDNPIDNYFAK